MSPHKKRDLIDTAYDFQRVVWPAIARACGGGTFKPVEGYADEQLQEDLDILAGIDGLQILPDRAGLRGIASRIQWTDRNWGTFTIRETRGTGAKTELEKRLYAIRHPERGLILPHLTVQAYITKRRVGQLVSVAVTRTTDLIPYANDVYMAGGIGVCRKPVKQEDGTTNYFLAVDWRQYKAAGYHIKIIMPRPSVQQTIPLLVPPSPLQTLHVEETA